MSWEGVPGAPQSRQSALCNEGCAATRLCGTTHPSRQVIPKELVANEDMLAHMKAERVLQVTLIWCCQPSQPPLEGPHERAPPPIPRKAAFLIPGASPGLHGDYMTIAAGPVSVVLQ